MRAPGAAGRLILTRDVEYGDTTQLSATAEEVSRLLDAYAAAIPSSGLDSLLPSASDQGRSPCLLTKLFHRYAIL